ncbi:SDR family NAD(P)-dependent oxidoreductase [Bacteriovorax sp. DB6_IX]|uniref:SDR family NAD(P)-dependent oxidoreductase n=1 Tax=Bacteriovorax sp. DB6_IX TaxID=1353530 RepID=UPI00038A0A27|nr:SDR family oxidoreductase [Bacteriovorax sp. DB6_IX]EQC51732.1 oxidoreductase, short chain dehydrogenase/reductase family protein [Bacteriovorax sp. DB6_IX]
MKTILITGGLTGLGEAISKLLDPTEFQVIRTSSRHENTDCHIYQWDMTQEGATKSLFKSLKADGIQPDIVIHCAHIFTPSNLVFSVKSDQFARSLENNIVPTFDLLKTASKSMSRKGEGKILLLGSLLSRRGGPGKVSYITEKNALTGLALAFSNELSPRGVHVSILHPGLIDTPRIRAQMSNEVIQRVGEKNLLDIKEVAKKCIEIITLKEPEIIYELGENQQW